MAWDRPLLDTIRERIKTDLQSKLAGANPRLRVNNLRVFAEVEAGTTHLLYGRLEWNYKQLFPDLADTESLIRWASIWGVKKSPATRARGPMVAAAEPGANILAGPQLQVEGGTTRFRVTSGAFETLGTVTFQTEAIDYGPEGNLPAGTVLRFLTTTPGIAPIATVVAPGITGGAPEDTDEELLIALLRRIQEPPHGGNKNDYEVWTLEVSGVTAAWCYPLERGLGTVAIRFMMHDTRAPDGIPTDADAKLVWEHLDPLRPVTADLGPNESLQPDLTPPGTYLGWGYVFPPVAVPAPVTIGGLDPDNPEIRAAIAAELADMIRHEAEPGIAVPIVFYYMAIGNAPGVRVFRLVAPAADVAVLPGQIVTLGPVTFVP